MATSPTVEFDVDAYLAQANKRALDEAASFDPDSYLINANVPHGTTDVPQEIPRPDATTGPTAGMDPFAYQGALMASPQGKQAMSTVAQTVKNMGLEGGGATVGQIAGAPFAEFGGVQVGGAIGGFLGNVAGQFTTPGKKFSVGEAMGAAVGGAVPGASLAKATGKTVAEQAGKYALTNVAAANVRSLAETGKPSSLSEDVLAAGAGAASAPLSKFLDNGMRAEASRIARQQDSLRRETLKAGQELGLVVPPSVVRPGPMNDTLQSVAGKAASAQEAVLRNQPKINEAVRIEIGLPPDAPLSPIAINTQRVGPNLVYDRISKVSPAAANLLAQFKQAQADTNELYAAYRNSAIKDPAVLAQAKATEIQADTFKRGLAKEIGPKLMEDFDAARIQLAKIGLADRATRVGDGNIDAKVFGDALEHGEKLTGNFAKIGKFQSAFGKYVQEAAKTPPSGVDYLKMVGKFGLGGGAGYAAGGVPGALAGTVAMAGAERGARNMILSPFYQRNFVQPFYGAATEDIPAGVARLGLMRAGRTPQTEDKNIFNYMTNPAPFMLPNN